MKKLLAMLIVLTLLLSAKPAEMITIRNPEARSLNEVCVVIDREKLKAVDSLLPIIKDSRSDKIVTSQIDDMNGDGKWDELVFLASPGAKEKLNYKIEWVAEKDYPIFETRTNINMGISPERNGKFTEVSEEVFPPKYECDTPYRYQFEGVGWENDKIAFRTYCDMRNGKDIFGKTGQEMILHQVGENNYHDDGDWGMDVLWVGSSLGIGAIAVIDEGKLIRLSDTEYHDFKLVTEGPLRSIFELNFEGWDVNGRKLSAKETITITAGRDGYKNCVEVMGEKKPEALVAGLSMMGNEGSPETIELKRSHGITLSGLNQADEEFLGMSILLPKQKKFNAEVSPSTEEVYDTESEDFKNSKYHAQIVDTYYLSTSGAKAEFVVHSIWGKRYPCISTKEAYEMMLEEEALHYFNRLKIRVK